MPVDKGASGAGESLAGRRGCTASFLEEKNIYGGAFVPIPWRRKEPTGMGQA
jgi:hypothetical protein